MGNAPVDVSTGHALQECRRARVILIVRILHA